ncbi:LysR family transcriptional regulator [Kitasatospora sp. NPDC002040]|uniref:LysR family transcriptional regulator n=1 Tax=Kitasatospora sp. NPDC002040 TaxID=3154661 RepID=UPI00332E04D3
MQDQSVDGGGRPVDLNLLRTFLAVYRAGSFTAAAPQLGLSQPTVTSQIRSLERQLGQGLFERQPRGVVPSGPAHDLAARVGVALDSLAATVGPTAVRAPHAPVRLAGPAEMLAVRVLPALAGLTAEGVRLQVGAGLTEPLLEELRAGQHDLVFATIRPRGRTLSWVPLMDEEFVLVAAPRWAGPAGHRAPVDADGPELLADVPLVAYAEDLPIVRRYWRHVFGRRLDRPAALTVADLRGVLSAVTAGAGFTVLPRYLCAAELAAGTLVVLHEPAEPPINTGYLVQRPGAGGNPHVALVRDRIVRAARDW